MRNRNLRKELAEDRAEARAKRSDLEQLELLETRGHGDCGEARRLITKMKLSGELPSDY